MKRRNPGLQHLFGISAVVYTLVTRSFQGCDGSGDSGPPPVGPDIRGQWSGEYYRTDRSTVVPLTATVRQDGDAVTIHTSKTEGRAQNLSGTIAESGRMTLTDAFDGQTWTTAFGPASTNRIKLGDYVRHPEAMDPDPPLYVLSLTR